jgi:hypothetical protein
VARTDLSGVRSATTVEAARAPERSSAIERVPALHWWVLLVVIVFVTGVAVWIVSPRFDLETPSLFDDWSAITNSSDQISDLARLENPEDGRFRPGWIVWNYVQWHTFDAPEGLVGPNIWNVARLFVLITGLSLLTLLALPRPRGPWEALLFPVLAGIPAFLVLMVPKFARDLTRFGTQEPLLIGGLALGGSLFVLAARALLDEGRPIPRWQTAALAVAGSGFWLIGAYQKESSVCALPLMAAVLLAGRSRLGRWRRLSSGRKAALAAMGAIAFVPLVHVTIEALRIATRGDLVYDAELDSGRGMLRGIEVLYDWAHEVFSADAKIVIYGAIALTLLATVVRRRLDVLAAGALASGALTFAFAGQSGVAVSRYYMPLYALFAVALALSLARLPRIVQLAALAWLVLAFVPPPGVRAEVSSMVEEERQEGMLVRSVAELVGSGCTVAMGGLDFETTAAVPVLVGLEEGGAETCDRRATYLVVLPAGEGLGLIRACARGALAPVLEHFTANLYRCERLRTGPVNDPVLGPADAARLVELRRIRLADE